jgi:hypothetical protein
MNDDDEEDDIPSNKIIIIIYKKNTVIHVQQQQKTKHTTPQNVTKTKHLLIIYLLFYLMVFVCIYCNYLINPIKTLIHQKSSLEYTLLK